jgi:hypothetical protein
VPSSALTNSSGPYITVPLLVFFPDVTSHSTYEEAVCLRHQPFHSMLTVPGTTETKAAPCADAPRSRVLFLSLCSKKCSSSRRFCYVKFFLLTILGMTQPVEISEKNDLKVSNPYCKHLGSKLPPFFVVFKLHAGLTTFNVWQKMQQV